MTISRNDSIVLITSEKDSDNLPILVSVKPNGKGRYELENIDRNFITSVHGRSNFVTQIEKVIEQDK